MIGVLFGPPGSGKGTQSVRLQADLGLDHVSTGDMLRDEVARCTPTGRRVREVMAAGDLVPDSVILELVRQRLAQEGERSFLLDGFPRTVPQAIALNRMLGETGRQVDFVIAIEVPEEVLVERILGRAGREGRSDDTRSAIVERMREYRTRTAPVLEFYSKQGRPVTRIDGVGTPGEVFERARMAVPRAA